MGKKRLLNVEEESKIILDNLDYNVAMTTTDNEISGILSEKMKNMSPHTKKHYCTEVKIRAFLLEMYSIQDVARVKPMTRYIAENSLCSAFSFAITVLSTHFIIGKSLSNKLLNLLSKEALETIEIVSKLNNNMPCMPINPNLVFSTDDTMMYVYEGIEEKKFKWRIVNVNAYKNKGQMSMYEINENTPKLKGMRIEMTTTHGASGITAPMCITVSGLDETELIMSDEELKKRRFGDDYRTNTPTNQGGYGFYNANYSRSLKCYICGKNHKVCECY